MIYIIGLILAVATYFYLTSNSTFFAQDTLTLQLRRVDLKQVLILKGRSASEIQHYLKAYDFFCVHTTKFDGATFVKDLHDIPNLDADAMVHDYDCLMGANRSFTWWIRAAWFFYENMRKQGKGNQIIRVLLLCVVGVIFVPYCKLFAPKYQPL